MKALQKALQNASSMEGTRISRDDVGRGREGLHDALEGLGASLQVGRLLGVEFHAQPASRDLLVHAEVA